MYDTSLVNKILKRADAAIQLQYFQDAMKEESKRRKDFYNWITEDVKTALPKKRGRKHKPKAKQQKKGR